VTVLPGAIVGRPFGPWRGSARYEIAVEVQRIAAFLDRPFGLEVGG
jgi:hypothetical protein